MIDRNLLAPAAAIALATLLCVPLSSMAQDPESSFSPSIATLEDTPSPALGAGTAGSNADDDVNAKANANQMSVFDLIQKGGVVGYMIIVLSIVSLGLIIDYFLTIRKSQILPGKDVATLRKLIESRNPDEMAAFEKTGPSFLSKVTLAGLKESHHGYDAMIKAMEDAAEALASGIARKTEHLNVIGNISPMLGLLGTVIGMLRCFNEIAHVAGTIEPKQLAGGIFEALVTTCMGLIVAIPALYSYAIFRNRVDEYTGEAALLAEQLVSPFKAAKNE
jgi:biopolymer transport protein ExbB